MNIETSFLHKINEISIKNNKSINIPLIESAIDYIKEYHKYQKRHSGEPYYYHPIEVATIVVDYIFDTEVILAAILHDTVEDTHASLIQIKFIFGEQVAKIVHILTKMDFDHQLSKEEVFYKINTFKDINKKATTIKIIDRLHNMRTIAHIKSKQKQKRIAKETLQFYIPLAKYADLPLIAEELQSIVSKILNF